MKLYSFNKKEKLKSEKEISRLFKNGKFLFTADLKGVYVRNDDLCERGVKVSVSVSKSRFKHAVDRNMIKRQVREAYRLSKTILYKNLENDFFSIHLMIIYNKNKKIDFYSIKNQVEKILQTILKTYTEK